MENPTISVLMPVYNGEKFLKEAIDSILEQSFKDFEFIIINDGSTDNTEEIILSYNDPRIVYVKNEKNIRLIKSLNKGIDLARGKFIARMDADEISLEHRFEMQMSVFQCNPNIDVVVFPMYYMNENGMVYKHTTRWYSSDAIRIITPLASVIGHPTILCKAELFKKNKYRDLKEYEHLEDAELWIRLIQQGHTFYMINEPLLYHRENRAGVSLNNTMLVAERYVDITKKYLAEHFDIHCSREELFALNLKFPTYKKDILFLLEKKLNKYFFIANAKNDLILKKELNKWKKFILVGAGLRALIQVPLKYKFNILSYLVARIYWVDIYLPVLKKYYFATIKAKR